MTTSGADRLSVLLTTEGTYPYHGGGVSTWCDALTKQLSEVDFTLLAVTMHPYLAPKYELAANVKEVLTVPLWGTEDPAEYGRHVSFLEYLERRWSTTREDIETEYLPAYDRFLSEVVDPQSPPRSLALVLLRLHQCLRRFDYHRVQTHKLAWDCFVRVARRGWLARCPDEPMPSLAELGEAWRLLYRLLLPLAVDVPRTHIAHSAAAAFCGLPCIIAKLRYGIPYLLTEHGVYMREQYLNLGRTVRSTFVRWFLFQLVNTIADVNYAVADQVSPVCQYNTRWERWRGVDEQRIHVIYNGVDPRKFAPADRPPNARPTVVSVGLIFPLKGQRDLIDAAALVRSHIPDVEFRLYGAPSDDEYYDECRARVVALGLERHVTFDGTTHEPWSVLQRADVDAFASVSEAFPYAVVEAMLTKAAIVATDVGGVHEALGRTGLLVKPRDPIALAEAIATMLKWPEGRARYGAQARDRALRWFTEQRFVDAYRATYERLARRDDLVVEVEPPISVEPFSPKDVEAAEAAIA